MTWSDRIKQAAYNAPDGTRIAFLFEDVSKDFDKKTSSHSFRGGDGTYMQDRGRSGNSFPVSAIFSGEDCDLDADTFESLLSQRGTGRLEHPLYGTFDVVPSGTVSRSDALVTAANESRVTVTFFETTNVIYPQTQTDPQTQIEIAVQSANVALADEYNDALDIETPGAISEVKGYYTRALDSTKAALDDVAAVQESINDTFNDVYDSINIAIDTLIADPLTLAFQTSVMIQAPARATAAISDRLDAYKNLANSIIGRDSEQLETDDLYVMLFQTGGVLSAVNNEFETKSEALNVASRLLDEMDAITQWRDDNYNSQGVLDTGESYQQVQDATALVAGWLVQISFDLKQERRITLSSPRTALDLVGELYNSTDENLDFFINSNALTGSEIIEIPAGREIVYYV